MEHCGLVGALPYVVLSDGPLDIGPASSFLELRRTPGATTIDRRGDLKLEQNALALRSQDGWLLFETGTASVQGYPNAGRLPTRLGFAGIAASEIVALLPTHAHLDHVGGIMDANGQRLFPQARIFIAQNEIDFWLDDAQLSGRTERSARVARKNLMPNRERITTHAGEEEILPGIWSFPAPGHSIGHCCYMISSGNSHLFIAGDLAHDPCQLTMPAISTVADHDAGQAIATRWRILEYLADRRILTLFYHFPYPGIGYVNRHGTGFRFLPAANPG